MTDTGGGGGELWNPAKWVDKENVVAGGIAGPAAAMYQGGRQALKFQAVQEKEKAKEIAAMMPGAPKLPEFPGLPQAGGQARATETARLKRYGGTASTILTGALGIPGGAVTQKKTLLGQ